MCVCATGPCEVGLEDQVTEFLPGENGEGVQRSGERRTCSRAVPDAECHVPHFISLFFFFFHLSITMYYITAGMKINRTVLF